MTDVEEVRPLELLHRAADYIGAVVCLTTTADRRHQGRRVFTRRGGARLSKLVVVIPARGDDSVSRWHRLSRGTVVAQADIVPAIPLDDIAQAITEQLTDQINRLRRGAA